MTNRPILIISGTNRPGASALKVAATLLEHYQAAGIPAEVFSLVDMPPEIYHPSAYAHKPDAFVAIQRRVLDAPGLHVVTPEYNGSFPGALKYFIDMLKFPESFHHKPVAFVGEVAGQWGALRAVEQLQMVFGYRNAHIFPERIFISRVHELFNEMGKLTDPALDQRLAKQAREFAAFIGCIGRVIR